MLELILFYIFGAITIVSAILVITQKNVVHSAVFLASTLLAVAGIFLTLHAEFLAGVQVIVYVGGILVLFVFVIMLISLERSVTERQFNRQWMIALIAAAALIVEFGYGIYRGRESFVLPPVETQAAAGSLTGNTQIVGTALFTGYLLPFEIASILLLVAIVGAVVLSKRKTQVD
jgi:NADH-quinone oxidoreductase subunit J